MRCSLLAVVLAVAPPHTQNELRVDVRPDGSLAQETTTASSTIESEPDNGALGGGDAPDAPDAPEQPELDSAKLEEYRFGVARLQGVVQHRDLERPNLASDGEEEFMGTGFVVKHSDTEGLVIATVAHLVTNAYETSVEFPAVSLKKYEGTAVLLNRDWDISLVSFPPSVVKEIEDDFHARDGGSKKIKVFGIADRHRIDLSGDTGVFALGFPEHQDSVVSTGGTISGKENVGGYDVIMTTAPISEGSSGGPLVVEQDEELKVCGIVFGEAAAENQQNNNYAVFSYRLSQMIKEYDALASKAGGHEQLRAAVEKDPTANEYRVPRIDVAMAVPNKDIYAHYNCQNGPLITHVGELSIMQHGADPPIAHKTFLEQVTIETPNGPKVLDLDKFGMAKPDDNTDPMSYRDLIFFGNDLQKPVKIKTCSCGSSQEHTLDLGWKAGYNSNVPDIWQTSLATIDSERFGEVTVQKLNRQLGIELITSGELLNLIPYVMEQSNGKPQEEVLIVTATPPPDTAGIEEGNFHGIFTKGVVLKSLNGKPVKNLEEFRAAFKPSAAACAAHDSSGDSEHHDGPTTDDDVWILRSEEGAVFAVNYHAALEAEVQAIGNTGGQAGHGRAPPTEFVLDRAREAGITIPANGPSLVQEAAKANQGGKLQEDVKYHRGKPRAIETRVVQRGGRVRDIGRAVGWA